MHKYMILALGLVLALAVVATPAQADDDLRATVRDEISKWSEAKDDNTFKVHWKNGLHLDSKNVQMRIGGLLMIDHYFVDDEDFVAAGAADALYESGVELRRARITNAGLLHGHVEWKLSVDFAEPNNPVLADGYIGLVNMDDCLGCLMPNIRVGHFKVAHGLEFLTPLKHGTFINDSTATEAFTFGRRYGVMIHDLFRGGQLGYSLGYFSDDTSFAGDGEIEFDNGYGIAARLWYTPWYDCECSCRRLHIGAGAYTLEDITSIVFQVHGPIKTGQARGLNGVGVAAEDSFGWNVELALVYGPWSLQAEYFSATPSNTAGSDPTFTGWYAQVSYWLTGECRNYAHGVFGRTSPCCNFLDNDCCCKGGIEVAARYSSVDLIDGAFDGGELTHLVVGINWHMNPNARIMLNWFTSSTKDNGNLNNIDESYTGIGVRFQVDW